MTPEGRVKLAVRTYLDMIGCIPASKAPNAATSHCGYYFMPVSNGMGVHGIGDIQGHYKGFYFTIETKVEKKDPTPLQQHQINAVNLSGGKAFVVRGAEDLGELRAWVEDVDSRWVF
jgi:hypothetical protein